MVTFTPHQVTGYRLQVTVGLFELSTTTYNLSPQATEGSV